MKIVLTGAAGFIGSCFLAKLNSMGITDVWVVDTAPAADSPNLKGKKFKDYLTREKLLKELKTGSLSAADGVVHLGACADTTERDREFLAANNVEYSKTLASWCMEKGKFFHYASSAAVYGDGTKGYDDTAERTASYQPLNPYGESKWLFDKWVIESGLVNRVVGYRYFNVFGPNEYHKADMRSMVCKAYDQWKADGTVRLFASTRPGYPNGSEERDFVYVKDVDEVMAFFLHHPDKHGIFNLGTGQARSFNDLVKAVFTALNAPANITYVPMPEKLRQQYQYHTQADLTHLRNAGCKKQFLSLEDAVADYVKNHLNKPEKYY